MAAPGRADGPSSPFINKGIVNISQAGSKDLDKLKLPDLMTFSPSESPIEEQLPKIFKKRSLQNALLEALAPKLATRENLTPAMYQKALKKAKEKLVKQLKERDKRGGSTQENEDIEALLADFEEMDGNNELLWLLRQVVHLA